MAALSILCLIFSLQNQKLPPTPSPFLISKIKLGGGGRSLEETEQRNWEEAHTVLEFEEGRNRAIFQTLETKGWVRT